MNLAVVGVDPNELAHARVSGSNTELILPDKEKIDTLERVTSVGLTELKELSSTSSRFQAELQQLAQEMRELETQSTSLYRQLDSRNKALEGVEPLVQARVIPPAIVGEICFGEIGPQWRAALVLAVQHGEKHDSELSKKLLLKVSNRIKDYYVSKVRRLRRPGIDAQTVQTDLIHNSALFEYLEKHHKDIAATMKQAYINTIKWYYSMLLEKYLRWIGRQPVIQTDKSMTIGNNVFAAKSFFSFSSSQQPASTSNMFSVGARTTVLSKKTQAMAWGTAPPANGFHAEVLVFSLISTLQDTITMESRVLREAFNAKPEVLGEIFNGSLEHAGQILDKLFTSWDVFDLLLSLDILQGVTGPELFTEWKDAQIDKIWMNVRRILEENSKSLESAVARPATSRKIGPEPHALTTTLASMLTGMLQLAGKADPVIAAIRQLLGVYEAAVTKLSKFSNAPELFLYNNYFLLSALLGDLDGDVAKEMSTHFQLLTEAYTPT